MAGHALFELKIEWGLTTRIATVCRTIWNRTVWNADFFWLISSTRTFSRVSKAANLALVPGFPVPIPLFFLVLLFFCSGGRGKEARKKEEANRQ